MKSFTIITTNNYDRMIAYSNTCTCGKVGCVFSIGYVCTTFPDLFFNVKNLESKLYNCLERERFQNLYNKPEQAVLPKKIEDETESNS